MYGGVGDEGSDLLGGAGVVLVHLLGVERLGAEEGVGDGVLLVAGVVDVRAQQRGVEQVDDAEAVAVDLVLVGGADAAAGGADGLAAGRGFGGELDHAVVGQDDLRAVGDEEVAVDFDAGVLSFLTSPRKAMGSSTTPLPMTPLQPGRRTPQGMSCRTNFLPWMMTVWPALWPPA